MFLYISTFVIILIATGIFYRKNRKVHIALMSTAFIIDFSLVLIIEIQRHAIENVIVNHNAFVWFHVAISTLVLVLYIVLGVTGSKMNKLPSDSSFYESKLVKIHKYSAILFVICRLTNYITSMFMPIQIHL